MKSLFLKWERQVESAYIISLKDNSTSKYFTEKCAKSCEQVNMPYRIWDAYDGTNNDTDIIAPSHLINDSYMNMLKLSHHYCTKSEVAALLSHVSLWKHCVEIDRPIVILEHDAIMVKPYIYHNAINSVVYLGSKEQYTNEITLSNDSLIPVTGSDGPNHFFIFRAHAYAIDPQVARNMTADILKRGLSEPADLTIRVDQYSIAWRGIYAYDENEHKTTILNRPNNPGENRTSKRNDRLKW